MSARSLARTTMDAGAAPWWAAPATSSSRCSGCFASTTTGAGFCRGGGRGDAHVVTTSTKALTEAPGVISVRISDVPSRPFRLTAFDFSGTGEATRDAFDKSAWAIRISFSSFFEENEKKDDTLPTSDGAKYVASRVTQTVPGVTESRVHAKRTNTTSFVRAATSSTRHRSEEGASGPIQAPALTASARLSHMSLSPRLTAGSTMSTRSRCCLRASSAAFVCARLSRAADADEQALRNDTSRSDWSGGR